MKYYKADLESLTVKEVITDDWITNYERFGKLHQTEVAAWEAVLAEVKTLKYINELQCGANARQHQHIIEQRGRIQAALAEAKKKASWRDKPAPTHKCENCGNVYMYVDTRCCISRKQRRLTIGEIYYLLINPHLGN